MNCTLLAIDGCPLSSLSGPMEILSLANNLLAVNEPSPDHRPDHKQVHMQIVSEAIPYVKCLGDVQLTTHGLLRDTEKTDVLIIAAIGHPSQQVSAFEPETLEWIRKLYAQGTQIVSICTGAFLLAETGLLNGKQATTHWACESLFRMRFPLVDLQSEHLLTEDGQLYCSGGASAYQDMALFLVRQHFGNSIAHQCAKAVLIDLDRHTQQQYASFQPYRQHQDKLIHKLQDWLKTHATESFSIAFLAEKISLSERQLKRRFKQATNQTPLAYIQALRIETAKHALETTNSQIEQVSRLSGYEDVRFFRQLFKRYTAVSPSEYRSKFGFNGTKPNTQKAEKVG